MGTEAMALMLGAVAVMLGLVLLAGGVAKFAHLTELRGVVGAYRLLPEAMVPAAAFALPVAEVLLGVLLLIGLLQPLAGIAAAGLFLVFAAAIAINLRRGRRLIDCGCFQSALRHSLHAGLVLRAALFALLSLAVAIAPQPAFIADTLLTVLPAGIALFTIHLALDHIWALGESGRRALRGLPT